jgi:CDP-paratose 2-epimerase
MKYLIIGGAGFIGINSADYFLSKGNDVTVLDNFSRKGTDINFDWLKNKHKKVKVVKGDTRHDQDILDREVENADVVLHFAAQVAVTFSVQDPRNDFENNALGSFNVLEAVRNSKKKPILVYTSTNKVYGGMEDLEVCERNGRYDYKLLREGVNEKYPLDFHSPYGCSKGCADQYIRDYARIYGLKTIVFRQSCIYGPHQFGIEDQGWVAWFTIATLLNKKLTIFGDGKQVRDVLHVEDLCRAYEMAIKNIDKTSGQVYNIGGGPKYLLSLLELINILESLTKRKIKYTFSDWRPGDQKVYVSNIDKAKKDFGWSPIIGPKEGVNKLFDWISENKKLF